MTYVYIKASTTCRYKSKPNILYKACMLFHVRGLTPVVHNWLFGPFPARPNLLYDFWMAALIQSIQTEAQWQSWIVCACAYSTFNCRENKGHGGQASRVTFPQQWTLLVFERRQRFKGFQKQEMASFTFYAFGWQRRWWLCVRFDVCKNRSQASVQKSLYDLWNSLTKSIFVTTDSTRPAFQENTTWIYITYIHRIFTFLQSLVLK